MYESNYFIRGYDPRYRRKCPPMAASHGCLRVPIPEAPEIMHGCAWARRSTSSTTTAAAAAACATTRDHRRGYGCAGRTRGGAALDCSSSQAAAQARAGDGRGDADKRCTGPAQHHVDAKRVALLPEGFTLIGELVAQRMRAWARAQSAVYRSARSRSRAPRSPPRSLRRGLSSCARSASSTRCSAGSRPPRPSAA